MGALSLKNKLLGKGEKVLYNLHVKLDDNLRNFDSVLKEKLYNRVAPFVGLFKVLDSGELVTGIEPGVHLYEASLDLSQDDHIHFDGGIANLSLVLGKPVLTRGYKIKDTTHTLQGLYRASRASRPDAKISILEDVLGEDNSIVQKEETKLKLLENRYRRLISDQ